MEKTTGKKEKEISISKIKEDPIYFLEKVLKLHIAKYHKEWIKFVTKNKRVCIMAPRGHGKTEVLIIGYMLWRAFTQPKFQGLIISNSLPQSTDVLRRIKMHIKGHPLLENSVPTGMDTSWSKTEIELTNGSRILTKPYSDSVRGFHVDVVCCDEVGTFEDHEIYTYAITPTVNQKRGSIIAIGTPSSKVDLLHKLFDNEAYVSKRYKSITNGKALWPKFFPIKMLQRIKKEHGRLAFAREYLCEPLGQDNQIFPYGLLEKSFLQVCFPDERDNDSVYYVGADFAMSGAAGSDYTVFTVIERNKNDQLTVVKIQRFKGLPYEAQKQYFVDLLVKYKPIMALLDESSFGQTFLQQIRGLNFPAKGFKFSNQSKNDLITNLINQFENNKIFIPRPSPMVDPDNTTRRYADVLIDELMNFGVELTRGGLPTFRGIGAHDDAVISLALAVYAATRFVYAARPRAFRSNVGNG